MHNKKDRFTKLCQMLISIFLFSLFNRTKNRAPETRITTPFVRKRSFPYSLNRSKFVRTDKEFSTFLIKLTV